MTAAVSDWAAVRCPGTTAHAWCRQDTEQDRSKTQNGQRLLGGQLNDVVFHIAINHSERHRLAHPGVRADCDPSRTVASGIWGGVHAKNNGSVGSRKPRTHKARHRTTHSKTTTATPHSPDPPIAHAWPSEPRGMTGRRKRRQTSGQSGRSTSRRALWPVALENPRSRPPPRPYAQSKWERQKEIENKVPQRRVLRRGDTGVESLLKILKQKKTRRHKALSLNTCESRFGSGCGDCRYCCRARDRRFVPHRPNPSRIRTAIVHAQLTLVGVGEQLEV